MDNETNPIDEMSTLSASDETSVPSPGACSEQEFERLYCDIEKLCVRMAKKKFGIPADDMQPIVHDVFISYLANPRVVRGDLRTYLIAAVYYQACNYWRSKRYEHRVFSDDDVAELNAAGRDDIEELCLELDVLATLRRLPQRCREALTLCARDEEPDAIAAALNTNPRNVYNVIHKCRKRARDIYQSLSQVQ